MAGLEQKKGLNGGEKQPGDGTLHKCFARLFVPLLILWLLNAWSSEGVFDRGFGLAVMRGSHLGVNGRSRGKRSPISVFVSVLTCPCPMLE